MTKENTLDLSQVSVANLLNENAPAPAVEEAPESVAEGTQEEQEETPNVLDAENPDIPSPEETPEEDTPELEEAPAAEEQKEEETPDSGESEEESSVIDILKSKLGYEVAGDYTEDYDGVVKFTQTVANEIAKEQLDSVFTQFPDVEQYLQFRYNGGDPKTYFQTTSPEVDFSAVELGEDDINSQRLVVQETMRRQGYSNEEINETVQDYLDAGILKKHADRGLGKLQEAQKVEASQLIEKQKAAAENRQSELQQQWQSIRTTIEQGAVRGFNIPTADKSKFFSWMSDAVDKQGRTQRLVDREAMDVETQVAMEYLLWKKFDLNKLVTNKRNTKKAKNLKSKLQQKASATKRMKGGKAGYTAPKKLPSLKDLL
jgi:hypothetical protein